MSRSAFNRSGHSVGHRASFLRRTGSSKWRPGRPGRRRDAQIWNGRGAGLRAAAGDVFLTEDIFVFPSWLVATVLVFAVLVTTIAAVYPARRAAQIDPVAALRHE